jgi:hypothetical protein
MSRLHLVRITGLLVISLVILLNIPYTLLIQNFEYDAILRKPVGYVLTQFQAGGVGLILTWFSFGVAALLFIPGDARPACVEDHGDRFRVMGSLVADSGRIPPASVAPAGGAENLATTPPSESGSSICRDVTRNVPTDFLPYSVSLNTTAIAVILATPPSQCESQAE